MPTIEIIFLRFSVVKSHRYFEQEIARNDRCAIIRNDIPIDLSSRINILIEQIVPDQSYFQILSREESFTDLSIHHKEVCIEKSIAWQGVSGVIPLDHQSPTAIDPPLDIRPIIFSCEWSLCVVQ
jgi:hypothetical protein